VLVGQAYRLDPPTGTEAEQLGAALAQLGAE